jgi:hypothetical protein
MEKGIVYQSDINNHLYTSLEPYYILRYVQLDDKWIIVDYDEMIKNLSNFSYHEYEANQSNDYVEYSYDEAYTIYMDGLGNTYIKIDDHYIVFHKISHLIKPHQLKNLLFYKEKFSRPFNDISGYKVFNGKYIFSQPHPDNDIYF